MTLEDFILAFRARERETKGKCFYCGTQTHKGAKESHSVFHTRDHVVPVSAKGKQARANRVVCCRKCNGIKEDLTLHEFKRRSGLAVFYAETLLSVRIDDLTDIEEITVHVIKHRRVEGRSIKFNGKPEPRSRAAAAGDFLPAAPTNMEAEPAEPASKG